MAHRCDSPCAGRIAYCLATVLILGMGGCVVYPQSEPDRAVTEVQNRPVWSAKTPDPSVYYPDPASHGYRATVWQPWPGDCVGYGEIAIENDSNVSVLDGEPIPAPPSEREAESNQVLPEPIPELRRSDEERGPIDATPPILSEPEEDASDDDSPPLSPAEDWNPPLPASDGDLSELSDGKSSPRRARSSAELLPPRTTGSVLFRR